jgi:hypothetical protein
VVESVGRVTLDRVEKLWVYRRDGITLPHGERRLEAIGAVYISFAGN